MKIILASGSPRRRQILHEAGFSFDVLRIDADESFPPDMPVRDVPKFLASKKMDIAQQLCTPEDIVITADTVVILGDEIINKPLNEDDGFQMLRKLSGQMHEVITAICIARENLRVDLEEVTKVYFEPLSDAEIGFYLSRFKPYDKAGAYAIQEWIGLNKIAKIEGNYYNVVGFPMNQVYKVLHELHSADGLR
jgi:septum formation protein